MSMTVTLTIDTAENMDLDVTFNRYRRRSRSVDSDYGLSSSASTIDPNESLYSSGASSFSLDSSSDDDVYPEPRPIHTEYLGCDETECLSECEVTQVLKFSNTPALSEDLKLVDEVSDMCDVCFLVGRDKVPVYGVKAILCARSRVLYNLIVSQEKAEEKRKQKRKRKRRLIFGLLKSKRWQRPFLPKEVLKSQANDHVEVEIPEFSPDVFRQVISFLHCGTIDIDISNVLSVMDVAEVYQLEELGQACFHFANGFINHGAVLHLLNTTDINIEFTMTKEIINKALDFVDKSAQSILKSSGFKRVSKGVAVAVLSRPGLRASELEKWDAALSWSKERCTGDVSVLRSILQLFTPNINLLEIPLCKVLLEVTPVLSSGKERQTFSANHWEESDRNSPESYRKSPASATSKLSLTSQSTDSGYTSSFRESCLL